MWLSFTALVLALLVLDLGVLNRRSHVLTLKEALSWSGGVVVLALGFGLFILWREGTQHALEYYTGYLIELSLSVDNLFVFLLIFTYFCVRADAQPKVLKWGILGAIVMRLIMIGLGAFLLHRFNWIVYVFGALLVATGIRMFTQKEERVDLERNPVVRLARRLIPLSPSYDGTRFFTRTATGKVIELASFTNGTNRTDGARATRNVVAAVPFDGTSARLKVSFDGKENAIFSYRADGSTWQVVGAPLSVALTGQVDLSWRVQAWSGAAIGLFAVKRGATGDNYADFEAFTVTSLD